MTSFLYRPAGLGGAGRLGSNMSHYAKPAPRVHLDQQQPDGMMIAPGMLVPRHNIESNPSRKFTDRDYYEITSDRSIAVMRDIVNFVVWNTAASALTTLLFPKIPLQEGVRTFVGKKFSFNIQPPTNVPMRGTVRLMSKSVSDFRVNITQKGIGSVMHGKTLRSPYGPELLAREIMAHELSFELGMLINTCITAVGVAMRRPHFDKRSSRSYGMNYSYEMMRQMRVWGSLGTNPDALPSYVDDMKRNNPNLNMLFVPDGFGQQIRELQMTSQGSGREIAYTRPTQLGDGIYNATSPYSVTSLATLSEGQVNVFPMPRFQITQHSEWQPLEVVNTIGEVYFVRHEMSRLVNERESSFDRNSCDIYVYNQKGNSDGMAKLKWNNASLAAHIWTMTTDKNDDAVYGYHPSLIGYYKAMFSQSGEFIGKNQEVNGQYQFPISKDASKNTIYIPTVLGSIGHEHVTPADLKGILSTLSSAFRDGGLGKVNSGRLSNMNHAMSVLEELRTKIENATYNPAYWAEVARLNVGRSIKIDNGRRVFAGAVTPEKRINGVASLPVIEWVGNEFGGMDVPTDISKYGYPAGMFSAAGLHTLASSADHPMRDDAKVAINFLTTLGRQIQELMPSSLAVQSRSMPANFHVDDLAELVLLSMYGPRLPVFLAAPRTLIDSASSVRAKAAAVDQILVIGNVDGNDVLKPASLSSIDSDETVFYRLNNGIYIEIPANVLKGVTPKHSNFVTEMVLNANIVGEDAAEAMRQLKNDLSAQDFASFAGWVFRVMNENKSDSASLAGKVIAAMIASENRSALLNSFTKKSSKSRDVLKQIIGSEIEPVVIRFDITNGQENPNALEKYSGLVGHYDSLINAINMRNGSGGYVLIKDDNSDLSEVLNNSGFGSPVERTSGINAQIQKIEDELGDGSTNSFYISDRTFASASATTEPVNARMYRAPMTFSQALLDGITRYPVAWINPGNPGAHSTDKIDSQAAMNTLSRYPHLRFSKGDGDRTITTIEDIPVMAPSLERLVPTRNIMAPFSGDKKKSYLSNERDWFHNENGMNSDKIRELAMHVMHTDRPALVSNMKLVYRWFRSNPAMRAIATAYLFVPANNFGAIRELYENNVRPNYDLAYWRLQSTHLMSGVLGAVGGVQTGANFYNGAHVIMGAAANTDGITIRSTLTTDAVCLTEENLEIVPCVKFQKNGYLGGHNANLVRTARDLKMHIGKRPSVIPTVVSLNTFNDSTEYPLSFVNHPPGRIMGNSNTVDTVSKEYQYWAGAMYYGRYVFADTFYPSENMNQITWKQPEESDISTEVIGADNHLAMAGYHVRYSTTKHDFRRAIPGNGHRKEERLNQPGAIDYLNGMGVLPPFSKQGHELGLE